MPRAEVSPHALAGEGNKQLKRAFFLPAFASLCDPVSRTYGRQEDRPGQTPCPGTALPRPSPSGCPVRHGSATARSMDLKPPDQADSPRARRASVHSRSNSAAEISTA